MSEIKSQADIALWATISRRWQPWTRSTGPKSVEGKAASSRNRRRSAVYREGMAWVKWMFAEGRVHRQILHWESKLFGVYAWDGRPCPGRAVTPRQVVVAEARLAVLEQRLAAIRAARPHCPRSFYEPHYATDADMLALAGYGDDCLPLSDPDDLLGPGNGGFFGGQVCSIGI